MTGMVLYTGIPITIERVDQPERTLAVAAG